MKRQILTQLKCFTLAIIAGVLALMVASCGPEKKLTKRERKAVKTVLASPSATDSVINGYLQKNPPKNDTTFLPGREVITERVHHDTIPLPYPVNDRYETTKIIEKRVTDTVKVMDKSFLESFQRQIDELRADVASIKAERDEWKGKAQDRRWWLVLTWVVVGAIIVIAVILFVVKQKYRIIKGATGLLEK